MSIAEYAELVADTILAGIPEFARETIQERRRHACWFYVRASVRAKRARTRVARAWWSAWRNKWDADCQANLETCAEVSRRLEAFARVEDEVAAVDAILRKTTSASGDKQA